MSSINDDILHYQRKINKYSSDTKVLLHCLNKLTKLPIGVEHLQATGIGRTINGMRKADGVVGEEARALVSKWKEMVAAEDKSESDGPAEEDNNQSEGNSDQEDCEETLLPEADSEINLKESYASPSVDDSPSTSKSKHSSSKSKSAERSSSKSSKSSDKRKELKAKHGESSSSSSKSRKRHHSQDSTSHVGNVHEIPSMSFEDALGSIESGSKKKKSKDKDKDKDRHRNDKKKSSFPSNSPPASSNPLTLSAPLLPPPKRIEIRASDFEISPDYKPQSRPTSHSYDAPVLRHKTSEEALSAAMAQKGSRTKVFSGNRSCGLAYAPTLFECCIRILQQNIDALEFTGGVPYELLRPVLERANAQQLFQLENYNPYLLEDTDELWKVLCQKEFRKAVPEEMESWRDLYLRCHEEREERLKNLTNNHKQSMAKAIPVRTTKLAYVDSVVKAPRGVGKSGQVKQGTSAVLASMTNAKASGRPFEASANHIANGSNAVAEVVKMAPPASRSTSSSSSAPAAKKPKVAPLMQKTLKLMKNRFRR